MLAQVFRLTGKDINFMTKKKQVLYVWNFLFFYIKQYQNLSFHQLSCHITLKLHKRSVVRHLVKRAILDYIQKHDLIWKSLGWQYYKFFIMLNKNILPQRQKQIETTDKKHIIAFVQSEFEKSRKLLPAKLREKKL